jgi:hypothetical protein
MGAKKTISAAQYLRMSTERQEYSLVNQAAAISAFAQGNATRLLRPFQTGHEAALCLRTGLL